MSLGEGGGVSGAVGKAEAVMATHRLTVVIEDFAP